MMSKNLILLLTTYILIELVNSKSITEDEDNPYEKIEDNDEEFLKQYFSNKKIYNHDNKNNYNNYDQDDNEEDDISSIDFNQDDNINENSYYKPKDNYNNIKQYTNNIVLEDIRDDFKNKNNEIVNNIKSSTNIPKKSENIKTDTKDKVVDKYNVPYYVNKNDQTINYNQQSNGVNYNYGKNKDKINENKPTNSINLQNMGSIISANQYMGNNQQFSSAATIDAKQQHNLNRFDLSSIHANQNFDGFDAKQQLAAMQAAAATQGGSINLNEQVGSVAGAPKINFSMTGYMKYLTQNSNLSTSDVYKYIFSKKCTKNYNIICLKIDLIKILSNINTDQNKSLSIIPHVMSMHNFNITNDKIKGDTLRKANDLITNKNIYKQIILNNNKYNTNQFINNILKNKIIMLINNISGNIKLYDGTTLDVLNRLIHEYAKVDEEIVEKRNDNESDVGEVEEKRSNDDTQYYDEEEEKFDGRGAAP